MSYGAVVTDQPQLLSTPFGVSQPMTFPGQIDGVPAGLEYMSAVDQLIIKQELSVFEQSEFCHRICCGPNRGFIFHIVDNNQQEVMTITRDFRCCAGCSWCADGSCCMYPIRVTDRHGHTLGMTRQLNYCCVPRMGIFDAYDQLIYEISGPCCPCQTPCCHDDLDYPIISEASRSPAGMIKKVWSGVLRECFTDVETFSVQFPLDLDVKHKALMFAAVFLVDFSIFEKQKKNNNK